jgi:hypothetical protein
MTAHRTLLASSLATLIGAGALLSAPAQAFDSIGLFWQEVYPNSLSDDNAMDQFGSFCGMCHERDDGGPKNGYANAVAAAAAGSSEADYKAAFVAVEPLNSDGDSCDPPASNLTEINADTQPGWAIGSTPPFTVTGLLDPEYCTGGPTPDPDINVLPTSIDYGTVCVGSTVTGQEVTIQNVGTADLTVTDLTLTNPVFDFGHQNVPTPPFTLAGGESVTFGVIYTPDAAGVDTGALEITSDDPDEGLVEVMLTGTGAICPGCVPSADPTSVDYGMVEIGTTAAADVTVTNNGDEVCNMEVSVQPCQGEFALDPSSPVAFDLLPGDSTVVTPTYTPLDEGADQCRMDILTNADDVQVPLTGEGVAVQAELRIQAFRATNRVRLFNGRPVSLMAAVRNVGDNEGEGQLTVVGQQNGVEVYRQVVTVSDAVGGGSTTYVLQSYFPTETGEIEWTATLVSAWQGSPDVDTATTTVAE